MKRKSVFDGGVQITAIIRCFISYEKKEGLSGILRSPSFFVSIVTKFYELGIKKYIFTWLRHDTRLL